MDINEKLILGKILIDKDAIVSYSEHLTPENFADSKLKEIYKVFLEIHKDNLPIDILIVDDRLRKKNLLEKIGGTSFLIELANDADEYLDNHSL